MQCLVAFVFVWLLSAGGSVLAQDLTRETESARAAIQLLRQEMMQHLQSAMQESGPAGATAVCRHLAPQIAARITAETGWQIRRPAVKARNPENRPTELERGALLGYLSRGFAGQSFEEMETVRLVELDGRPYVHYMRAIPMLDACGVCHGKSLPPDVAAAIREIYPEDEAVGFMPGDLRGAFSLLRPYDPAAAPLVARAPRLPEVQDAPAEVPLGLGGKPGDPAAGRELFGRHCLACHDATDLALVTFPKDGPGPRRDVCVFLQTHGLTDEARDCDIVAYLKVLAGQLAD